RIAALRAAIEEGEASGYVEDFDFDAHLEALKAKRRDNG
ncbi:MAG: type II toxin-antitoxin system ParD family antitoxin, partial [Prevotella sp.]|nr:type II toxin-antitoxin system ParD family antitoxin [Prevotella sp.]